MNKLFKHPLLAATAVARAIAVMIMAFATLTWAAKPPNLSQPVPDAEVGNYPYNTVGRIAYNGYYVGTGTAIDSRIVLTTANTVKERLVQMIQEGSVTVNTMLNVMPKTAYDLSLYEDRWFWKAHDHAEMQNRAKFAQINQLGLAGKVLAPAPAGQGIPARYVMYPTYYGLVALNAILVDHNPQYYKEDDVWNQDIAFLGFLQNCTNASGTAVATPMWNAANWSPFPAKYNLDPPYDTILGYSKDARIVTDGFVPPAHMTFKMMVGYPFGKVRSSIALGQNGPGWLVESLPERGLMHRTNPAFFDRFYSTAARPLSPDPRYDKWGFPILTYQGNVAGWLGHSGSPLFVSRDNLTDWQTAGVYVWATKKGFHSFGQIVGDFLKDQLILVGDLLKSDPPHPFEETWKDFTKTEGAFRLLDHSLAPKATKMRQALDGLASYPPANDDRQNAETLNPRYDKWYAGEVDGDNLRATRQSGEPQHDNAYPTPGTVWYLFERHGLGEMQFKVRNANFKSVVAVYGIYEDGPRYHLARKFATGHSRIDSFETVVTVMPDLKYRYYYVVVAGISSQQGTFTLSYQQAPDTLPLAYLLGSPQATLQTNQSLPFLLAGMDLEGSVGKLSLLVNAQEMFTANVTSLPGTQASVPLTFKTWARGPFILSPVATDQNGQSTIGTPPWTVTVAAPPGDTNIYESNLFTNSAALVDADGDGTIITHGSSWFADLEPLEPTPMDREASASVWWRWTAPANGYVTITCSNTPFQHRFEVFTGNDVASLARVESTSSGAYNAQNVCESMTRIRVQKDTVYHLRVIDSDHRRGDIDLKLEFMTSNMPPTSRDLALNVNSNEDNALALAVSDPDLDVIRWTIVQGPAHGTLAPGSGLLTSSTLPIYHPASGYEGSDSLTVSYSDGEVTIGPFAISLYVRPANAGGAVIPFPGEVTSSLYRQGPQDFFHPSVGVSSGLPGYNFWFQAHDSGPDGYPELTHFGGTGVSFTSSYFYNNTSNLNDGGRVDSMARSGDQYKVAVGGSFDSIAMGDGWLGGSYDSGRGIAIFEYQSGRYISVPTAAMPGGLAEKRRTPEALTLEWDANDNLLVGGITNHTYSGGTPYKADGFFGRMQRVVRKDASYEWDTSFMVYPPSPVLDIAVAPDGSIYTLMRDAPHLMKWTADGTQDTSFLAPSLSSTSGVDATMVFLSVEDPNTTLYTSTDPEEIKVNYEYQIGAYEVTNDQYAAFLNAVATSDPYGLYAVEMGTHAQGGIVRSGVSGAYSYTVKAGFGNKPVVFVGRHDAARFVNWLAHQCTSEAGVTEHGAYELNGTNPATLIRNAGSVYFIPTAAEWNKAAYFQSGPTPALSSVLWAYPCRSQTAPTPQAPPGGANSANCAIPGTGVPAVGGLTAVGSYANSRSEAGVYDMAGNVGELIESGGSADDSSNLYMGGGWNQLMTQFRFQPANPTSHIGTAAPNAALGFRVARINGANPIRHIEVVNSPSGDRSQLIVCGSFSRIGGVARQGLARLNEDGSVDATFTPDTTYGGRVQRAISLNTVEPVGDGGVLVGGEFVTSAGVRKGDIFRFKDSGTLDPAFVLDPGASASVDSLLVYESGITYLAGGLMQPIVPLGGNEYAYSAVAQFFLNNKAPLVAFRELPADNTIVAGGTHFLGVAASDPDGTIKEVVFDIIRGDGQGPHYTYHVTEPPYRMEWKVPDEITPGNTYLLYVSAVDNLGLQGYTYVFLDARDSDGMMPENALMPETMAFCTGTDAEGSYLMTMSESGIMPMHLAQRDLPGHAMKHLVDEGPEHGELIGVSGNWVYVPEPGYAGTDTMVIRSLNMLGDMLITRVDVTVVGTDDPPVAYGSGVSLAVGGSITFTPTFSDPDGDTVTLQVVSQPSHGLLQVNGYDFTYTPTSGYTGSDQIKFKVNDGHTDSATAAIDIEVYPIAASGSVPSAVAALNASDGQSSGIHLSWVQAVGASYYEILRGTASSVDAASVIGMVADETFYLDATAAVGATYYYWVRAANAIGSAGVSPPDVGTRAGADSDGDGMSDAWEIQYSLNSAVNDANLDADDDGMTNLEEFLADTSPRDPNSFFRVTQALVAADGNSVHLTWPSKTTRNYAVQVSNTLGTGEAWETLGHSKGTAGSITWTGTVPAPWGKRFFRVKIDN